MDADHPQNEAQTPLPCRNQAFDSEQVQAAMTADEVRQLNVLQIGASESRLHILALACEVTRRMDEEAPKQSYPSNNSSQILPTPTTTPSQKKIIAEQTPIPGYSYSAPKANGRLTPTTPTPQEKRRGSPSKTNSSGRIPLPRPPVGGFIPKVAAPKSSGSSSPPRSLEERKNKLKEKRRKKQDDQGNEKPSGRRNTTSNEKTLAQKIETLGTANPERACTRCKDRPDECFQHELSKRCSKCVRSKLTCDMAVSRVPSPTPEGVRNSSDEGHAY